MKNAIVWMAVVVLVLAVGIGGYMVMQERATPLHSVKQDASLVASENIIGRWQSVDDENFIREFKVGNVVEDWHAGELVASDRWVAFEKGVNAPTFPHPLEYDTVYIQITMSDTQGDTMNFKLTNLTTEELELIYLDRGGALRFRRIE